jgi:hypothetical protein
MTYLTIPLSPTSRGFLPIGSKHSFQHPNIQHSRLMQKTRPHILRENSKQTKDWKILLTKQILYLIYS